MRADRVKQRPTAAARPRRDRLAWLQAVLAIAGAVLPLLPSFSCPVCIAAYAGVLSSLGLGFVLNSQVQEPLIVLFLTITAASVAWATMQHRRLVSILLVLPGSVAIVAGRVLWSLPWLMYLGAAAVVVGAVWNLAIRRPRLNLIQIALSERRTGST